MIQLRKIKMFWNRTKKYDDMDSATLMAFVSRDKYIEIMLERIRKKFGNSGMGVNTPKEWPEGHLLALRQQLVEVRQNVEKAVERIEDSAAKNHNYRFSKGLENSLYKKEDLTEFLISVGYSKAMIKKIKHLIFSNDVCVFSALFVGRLVLAHLTPSNYYD